MQRPHLEWDVRDVLPQLLQPPPGAFVQEAQSNIKSSTSPHLQGASWGQDAGCGICCLKHVVCAHAGGQ